MTTQPIEPIVYFRTVISKEDIDKFTYNPNAILPQAQAIFANQDDAIAWLVKSTQSRLQLMDSTPITNWTTTNLDNGNILLEGLK